MGLNCSHGAFDGAYPAFNRLRKSVVEEACSGAWPPYKYGEETYWQGHLMEGDSWAYDDNTVPEEHVDGMLAFCEHSDCEGELTPDQCVSVAKFLRWAAPQMKRESGGHLARYGATTACAALNFADGCDRAAVAGEALTFG